MTTTTPDAQPSDVIPSNTTARPSGFLRDMFTIMADKIPVEEGVSFEDAIDAMKLRANLVNFKQVGHQPMWKEIEATSGEPTPKVEIFQFCDAMVAREILANEFRAADVGPGGDETRLAQATLRYSIARAS